MKPMKSQEYLARWYEKGGSTPLPITLRLDGGEIVACDANGHAKSCPFDDWELTLGGTREDRVVLKSHTTGETIIADLKILDAIAAGTRYPLLTKQAKKLKSGGVGRFFRQSSGVIFILAVVLLFGGCISLGILGSQKDGPVTRRPHDRPESAEEQKEDTEAQSGSTADMPTDRYMSMIQRRIKANWHPHSHKAAEAIVLFNVDRDGTVSKARMKESTGDKALDKVTVEAVERSSPLPSLPNQIEDPAEIEFNFKVNK
jgi:TonB family protein